MALAQSIGCTEWGLAYVGLALLQFVSTLLLADAAEEGMTELARVVTAGSIPAFAVWALRNSGGTCQASRA